MTAVLERCKAAGTLLPGCCLPVEETFQMAVKRKSLVLQGHTQAEAAADAAVLALYVGVETYARAAASVAYMLNNMDTLMFARAFVLSDEQKNAAYLFLASAMDVMMRPRDIDSWVAGEPGIVQQLRILVPKVSGMNNPEAKKLCAAWWHVMRSGMLRVRGIDEAIDRTGRQEQQICAAAEAEVAAGRLQQCALAGCAAPESHASQFKRCGACRTVCYCSREHQLEDWPSHKAACKAARKAVADSAGDT